MKIIYFILFSLITDFSARAQSVADYIGHFSGEIKVSDPIPDSIVSNISVEKASSGFRIEGSYAYSSGRSPAPDFTGTAYPSKNGNLYFKFSDSFGNTGEGSLSRKGKDILLNLRLEDVKDSRCAALYIPVTIKAEQDAAANP